jgi:putative proteasome-type protease
LKASGVDFNVSLIFGGQIAGEGMRLFQVYSPGNFIEATAETPYFQIGESKYGKPVLDRAVNFETNLDDSLKVALVSMDSTMRSNLGVGLPIDMLLYRADSFAKAEPHRITADDPYFNKLRRGWGEGLKRVFAKLPDDDWFS